MNGSKTCLFPSTYFVSPRTEDLHLASFKEFSANKQGLVPWAMVFIIIGTYIQFSTSCLIFVSFVPGLILLYIDSHPPGLFAAIGVWLVPVWLMRFSGLPASSVFRWNRGGTLRFEGTSLHKKLWVLVSETFKIKSAHGLWSVLNMVNRDDLKRPSKVN